MPRVLAQKHFFSSTSRQVTVTALVEEDEYEPYDHTIVLFSYINQSQHSVGHEFGCGQEDWKQIFERCDAEFCRSWLKQQHLFFAADVPEAMWELLDAPV